MDPGRVVFDISSDEDQDWSEPKSDDYDWISELLGDVDKQTDDDCDEVVVVGEVKPKPRSKSLRQKVKDVDDDCVVLDGDPDKPVEAMEDSSGSDDLFIIGEKGQIACRDFPHPRHHCASFPFSTTPHERHCNQCHCYVCDSLAPCVNWGTGTSSMDHCHATDKEETWKIQRRNFKLGKNATLSTTKISDTSLSVGLPQANQVAPLNIICLSPSPTQQNPVSMPAAIRACTSSNFSVPNIISQGRSQQPGFAMDKNRLHPQLISQQIPTFGARNNNFQRSKFQHMGNFHPQLAPPHISFKRSRNFGVSLQMGHPMYSSSTKDGCANPLQYARNHTSMAISNGINTSRWEDVNSSTNQSSSHPNLASVIENTLPSQTQMYDRHVPSSNHGQDFIPTGSQIQNHDQGVCQYGNLCVTAGQNFSLESSQIANATDMDFPEYSYSWLNNTNQSNQQGHVEHSQVQNTEPVYEPSFVKDSNPEFIQCNNPSSVALDFENWFMDNQSVPVSSDGSVPSQLNALSPQAPVDAGMLCFDFETSWNGLTHV